MALELVGASNIYDARGNYGPAVLEADALIVTHATHFAGAAAKRMLVERHCPLCFANKNPAGVHLDAWVENAAEEIKAHGASVGTVTVIGH